MQPNRKMLNLNLEPPPIVEPVFALKALHLYNSCSLLSGWFAASLVSYAMESGSKTTSASQKTEGDPIAV